MSQFGNLSCTRGAEVTLSAASTTTSAPFMGQVPFCPTTGICQRHLWQSCLSSFLPFSVCFSSLNIIHSSPSRYLELYLKVMFEVGIQNRGTDVEKLVVLFVFYWLSDWQCCFVCPTECQEPSEQQGFKDPVGQRWLFNHHWLWFGEITFIYIYTFVQWVLQDHTIVSSESDTEQIEEKVTIGILHKHQYSFKRLIKLK